mmetsp:Transcript_4651/g.10943  ORF Transcript_4651/g.10943 Transcript_4651/m.10943 type:complete len:351 (-) Transcript_4651:604-1656(-)
MVPRLPVEPDPQRSERSPLGLREQVHLFGDPVPLAPAHPRPQGTQDEGRARRGDRGGLRQPPRGHVVRGAPLDAHAARRAAPGQRPRRHPVQADGEARRRLALRPPPLQQVRPEGPAGPHRPRLRRMPGDMQRHRQPLDPPLRAPRVRHRRRRAPRPRRGPAAAGPPRGPAPAEQHVHRQRGRHPGPVQNDDGVRPLGVQRHHGPDHRGDRPGVQAAEGDEPREVLARDRRGRPVDRGDRQPRGAHAHRVHGADGQGHGAHLRRVPEAPDAQGEQLHEPRLRGADGHRERLQEHRDARPQLPPQHAGRRRRVPVRAVRVEPANARPGPLPGPHRQVDRPGGPELPPAPAS